MKRTLAIILTVFLIATTAVLLVACDGGIKSEEDWNNAIEAFLTADAVTLKIKDDAWTYQYNIGILDRHDKTNVTLAFDAEMGVVAITHKYNDYSLRGGWTNGTYLLYYVKDGADIIYYRKYEGSSFGWSRETRHFDTEEQAAAFLREQYTNPYSATNSFYREEDKFFPTFDELEYSNFEADTWGKFEYVKTDSDGRVNTYTLNFTNGKPSKFTFDTRIPKEVVDTDKYSVTISYSAKITLPDGLPTEDIDTNNSH